MWECGLKLRMPARAPLRMHVTPYVGVWIETRQAPYRRMTTRSHSLCGSVDWNTYYARPLKRLLRHSLCGSVDWNRAHCKGWKRCYRSLLMWECGLKPTVRATYLCSRSSLLMWECGLKLFARGIPPQITKSLLMWECGLKLPTVCVFWFQKTSLLMWECGLKRHCLRDQTRWYCHSLCGSVDWNIYDRTGVIVTSVTPYVGVWIETCGVPRWTITL